MHHVFFKTESPLRFPPNDNSPLSVFFFRSLLCHLFSPAKRFPEFCKCSLMCNFTFVTYFKSFVSSKEFIASRVFVLHIKLYLAEFSLITLTIKIGPVEHMSNYVKKVSLFIGTKTFL